jgi:single-strand DNA-binding protein
MARGINKVILVGNIGKDPETRYTASGAAITSISVATSEAWKDKQTGEAQERTEWHRVKFFGRLAEIAGEYLKKGSQVYIEGKLRTDKYTAQDGTEKYSTDIIADEMQMLGSRGGAGTGESGGGEFRERAPRAAAAPRATGSGAGAPARNAPSAPPPDQFEDDIPF